MQAISALRGHDVLSSLHRGRNRAVSEVHPPPEPELRPQPLSKAASYTYFPRVKELDEPAVLGLSGTISEDELKHGAPADGTSSGSSDGSSADSDDPPPMEQKPQLRSSNSRRSTRFLSFSSKSRDPSAEPKPGRSRSKSIQRQESSTSISPVRSLSALRRKSWVGSHSRSASPSKDTASPKKDAAESRKNSLNLDASKRRTLTAGLSIAEKPNARDAAESPTRHKSRLLSKKNKRLSGLFNPSNADEKPAAADAPSVPPVPAAFTSFSTDKLPSYAHVQSPTSPTQIPPLPRNISSEKIRSPKTEPRKKDELWNVFRTLDADLRKFQSKSTSLKANVVRTTLLPFLRSYASHPSNRKLRPEDLDRRANILNGWWTGLLELLAGRNNQSISGTDRPAILEGIAGVMERPEWRMAPSLAALADRTETASTMTTKSAASNNSSSSDFLAESVYHNVRNVFTQNLLSQMAFVIDKMSLRNAAASLVTFCGKTCAYAFCFCPGVADVLVRLWNPSPDTMKRVLEESGIARMERLDTVSDRIAAAFPPMLQSLKFDSLTKTTRMLRRPATPPLGAANLDWYGSWTKRWSGAESDLFYVFVKHFHILVTEFLPLEPSNVERICAPGLIMVHAQVLTNLDATVNRNHTPQQIEESAGGAAPITFDDVLETDAQATALPMPPANATRLMAENRVIMLLRDFLSERNSSIASARRLFAVSFQCLLKATARKVPIFDNSACYTLCDFLEEAFVILVRYGQLEDGQHPALDWPFWLSVCKQMTASHNTATEIRLFAFLYTTWPTLVSDPGRKQSLCLDFLLEPEFFESRFNHWCPMVRAYFMRLLCWRVARFDDVESDIEISIMKTLSERLRSIWSHYLWVRDQAEINNAMPPSTQACNPAPGRRFLIIRNDNPIVTNTQPFLSFDGVVQSPTSRKSSISNSPPERPLSAMSTDSQDFPDETATKGRWSMLRSFMSGTPKQTSKSKNHEPSRKDKENAKATSNGAAKSAQETSSHSQPEASSPPPPPAPTHRSYSFRFSLEWVDKRFGIYQNMRLSPPRLPLPAQVLLQSKGITTMSASSCQPPPYAATSSTYAGRALAEWTFVSHECQNFFDRRKNEGVPSNKLVENPSLAVEAFRRPG